MIFKNKGMFLETIINQSIPHLLEHNVLIQKMPLDNTLLSVENSIIKGKLKTNNFCDYTGLFQGYYLEFEAKETELDYFSLHNIKCKQLKKLQLVNMLGGISFILIYFHTNQKIYALSLPDILQLKTKKIPLPWIIDNGIEIIYKNLVLQIDVLLNHLINCKL